MMPKIKDFVLYVIKNQKKQTQFTIFIAGVFLFFCYYKSLKAKGKGMLRPILESKNPVVFKFGYTKEVFNIKDIHNYLPSKEKHLISISGVDELKTSKKITEFPNKWAKQFYEGKVKGYLKQVDFADSKLLQPHIPRFLQGFGWDQQVLIWIGSKGAKTGLHYDPWDSILMQFEGSQKIYLLPPDCAKYAYQHNQYDTGSTDFMADVEFINSENYPLFEKVRNQIRIFTIKQGEALYIPKRWLHEVIITEDSMSVNAFIKYGLDYFFWNWFQKILNQLHTKGFYSKGNCVCCINKGQEYTF